MRRSSSADGRASTRATYLRTINAGYYGIGNATTVAPAPGQASLGRRFQYLQQEGWLRTIARLRTGTVLDVAIAGNLRYEAPAAYAESKLAADLDSRNGAPAVVGGQSALLGSFTAGAMIDTRDSEFVTTRGIFYQLGVAATVGSAEEVANGEVSAVLAHYAPLGGPFVFASRIFASFRFGRVPFYDLQTGGAFEPESLLGGDQGVRGVPIGRYAGLIKAVANMEIRSTPFPAFSHLWRALPRRDYNVLRRGAGLERLHGDFGRGRNVTRLEVRNRGWGLRPVGRGRDLPNGGGLFARRRVRKPRFSARDSTSRTASCSRACRQRRRDGINPVDGAALANSRERVRGSGGARGTKLVHRRLAIASAIAEGDCSYLDGGALGPRLPPEHDLPHEHEELGGDEYDHGDFKQDEAPLASMSTMSARLSCTMRSS